MNEYEELHLEWGMSTCGKTVERFIYDRLSEQLAKERDLRKELVDEIDTLLSWSGFSDFFPDEANKLEEIIKRAKDTRVI